VKRKFSGPDAEEARAKARIARQAWAQKHPEKVKEYARKARATRKARVQEALAMLTPVDTTADSQANVSFSPVAGTSDSGSSGARTEIEA
jgi:acyl-CoA reductase-like NAD-dependent aldehyde dehydrogenase